MIDYEQSAAELFQLMEKRVSEEDLNSIRKAYEFAKEAHKEQKRKTGEPYIIHPVAVARIVAEELQLGTNPIIAAFLHDVVEDTPYTIEDIKKEFGEDVAFLVDVVTKKGKDAYQRSKQVDNYQQILDSVNYDIRALLVKLSDRLHNMRTLDSMRSSKQMKIAGETDFFYAPLATRLGLYTIGQELENLSFRFRCPGEFDFVNRLIEQEKNDRSEKLERQRLAIADLLAKNGVVAKTEVVYHNAISIWRKMKMSGRDYHHVDGKKYVRITFPAPLEGWTEKDFCLYIYSMLTNEYKERPRSVVNYIDHPKANGYQSFHFDLFLDGGWENVHVESEKMLFGNQLGCVAFRDESNINLWIDKFRTILKDVAEKNDAREYMEGLTSAFYSDDILVYTPKGDCIILPKDASVIDFAYEIHRNIGDHAQFARINGRLAPVTSTLSRGDCVQIYTNERKHPKAEWLQYAMTYKAKKHIRLYLNSLPTVAYCRCEKCNPLPGDAVIGIEGKDGKTVLHKRDCSIAISLASQQGDCLKEVDFQADPDVLYPVQLQIMAIDRYHLLSDLISCITDKLRLSMHRILTEDVAELVTCTVHFSIHSAKELSEAINTISSLPGVDEVNILSFEE